MNFLKKAWFTYRQLKTWLQILIALVVIGLIGSVTGQSNSATSTKVSENKTSSSRVYSSTEISSFAINPATLSVKFRVTNDGTVPVTPDCTVKAKDASGTYSGFDIFSPVDPIKPGQSLLMVGQITITKQGAEFADQLSVNCVAQTMDTSSISGKQVSITNIEDCSDYDPDANEWWWGACFKGSGLSPMTQMDCTSQALNSKGEVILTDEFRANTLNDGSIIHYGTGGFPTTTKSNVKAIKSYKISCTL
jgi:hypothetical protein